MHWQFTPYVFPVMASAVVSAALASYAWHRRPALGATSFSLLMLAVAGWSLAYALELVSSDLPAALFWDNIGWLGAACAPTLWLAFVLQYTGRARWLTRRNMAILLVEPLVTLLLVWTNQFHGLIEDNIRLDTSGSFSALILTYGIWYWINIAYSYLLLFVGAILICMLIQTLMRPAHLYFGQAGALLIAVLAPWVGNALTIFGLNPFPKLDLTPFAFTVTGIAMASSLFRFRLLDIIPVAREAVFESMRDAVIVVDEQNRIVDLNIAAHHLAHCPASRAVGQPFTHVFAAWPELVEHSRDVTNTYTEIVLGEGGVLRYFDLRISSLYRRNGHRAVAGRLIVLNDITEHMEAERALRESEERFRNIFEEAPIGMAVVGLDGRLLQVNKAFCEMLGYSEQELTIRGLSDITHPNDVGKDGLLAAQMLKGAITIYKVEKRYLRKNREPLWADLTATVIRDHDGQAVCSLVMIENIIERKQAKLLEEERHHVAYELHDGLATALRLQVEAQRTEGWTIGYDETLGSERLPPTIETTLFGVAQEALTNARKHASTTRARLALERQESKIRLVVQDWGCGFEPLAVLHEASLSEHVGLREMQERVELVSGHLMISSQPGVGTLVVAEVPLLSSNEGDIFHEQ